MEHNHFFTADALLFSISFLFALTLYCLAVCKSNRKFRKWPRYRMICWFLGVISVMGTVIGPIADRAHSQFIYHMAVHLLLGMLAPLLLVLSQPITLILRTLPVPAARKFSNLLKSWPVQIYCHPIVASVLNIGGLWVLYTTELFSAMQHHPLLHFIIHIHVFLSGYLFTVSMIYVEPSPHRYSFVFRAVVFILALAGHGILAKYVYTNPPKGVALAEAEAGGMLMYYGGDAVDLILITIFCYQWYKASRPHPPIHTHQSL